MVLVACWPMGGAYLDAWAHSHVARLETFFTPWHAVLYSGVLAITLFMAVSFATGWREHRSVRAALPPGYGLSFAGCLLFAIVGPGDLAWHTAFGIERGFAAVMSPTHVVGMIAMALIVSGPLRASWLRPGREIGLPALISAGLLLSAICFFQAFDHPFVQLLALSPGSPGNHEAVAGTLQDSEQIGVLAILVEAVIVAAYTLLLLRRFDLPWAGLGFVLGLNAALLSAIGDQYAMILVAVLTGLAAEGLARVLLPGGSGALEARLLSAAVPLVLFALYFAAVAMTGPIWWPVHVWAGAIGVAGIAGWLVSYAIIPPVPMSTAG